MLTSALNAVTSDGICSTLLSRIVRTPINDRFKNSGVLQESTSGVLVRRGKLEKARQQAVRSECC